ncbi:DUF4148 domain-containing protein [Paraburkholderia tropica]|uniref:DUF4148 domain-containing protein n=1 Tax=Paraburkholderia tropica TaxID=92647 RepID=UPI002AB0EAE1|nr:DUF4148 domain-containing protein [Paraburkholderia tropica]
MMVKHGGPLLVKAALIFSVASLAHFACAQPASAPGASTTKMTKAQRKAARKEARAKKNAELKQLQQNGYNPAARSDLGYPQNLQRAQRKAAEQHPASQ